MKRSSTTFLQVVIVLVGIGTLALMLWEPHLEGRNVNATLFQIYFNDPFLVYAYIGSIAFFVALYQAFIDLCITNAIYYGHPNKEDADATVWNAPTAGKAAA